MLRTTAIIIAVAMTAAIATTTFAQDTKKADASEKGRDWTKIDTNKDGYIQPEEMEKWLAANPGPAKK